MYGIFQICFYVGLLMIVVAFFIGQICDVTGIDGLDLSIGDVPLLFPFSPLLIFLFATIFGGSGMLLLTYVKWCPYWMILLAAAILGSLVCIGIRKFILIPLKKAENTSAAEADELIGLLAKVNEKVPKGGFGEITYTINGNSYVAPAKSTTGEEISAGTEVSICWIKDHVFYITKIDKFTY